MPREYRHIKQYEKEIIELWEQGRTLREIVEKFGFTKEQVQEFKTRYNKTNANSQREYQSSRKADLEKTEQNCHHQYSD